MRQVCVSDSGREVALAKRNGIQFQPRQKPKQPWYKKNRFGEAVINPKYEDTSPQSCMSITEVYFWAK